MRGFFICLKLRRFGGLCRVLNRIIEICLWNSWCLRLRSKPPRIIRSQWNCKRFYMSGRRKIIDQSRWRGWGRKLTYVSLSVSQLRSYSETFRMIGLVGCSVFIRLFLLGYFGFNWWSSLHRRSGSIWIKDQYYFHFKHLFLLL